MEYSIRQKRPDDYGDGFHPFHTRENMISLNVHLRGLLSAATVLDLLTARTVDQWLTAITCVAAYFQYLSALRVRRDLPF